MAPVAAPNRLGSVHRGVPGPELWTDDGIPLATRCWLVPDGAEAIVVLVHGFTGSKDDIGVVSLASTLYDRGIDVIAYDCRGHGQSGGESTLGDLERFDVAAAVKWAKARNDSVILVGASMGAVAVLAYAATTADLSGVVAVSSPSEWRLPLRVRSVVTAVLARTRPGRLVVRRRMHVRIGPWTSPESPRALAERIRCPLVALHGRSDPIIPAEVGLGSVLQEGPRTSVVFVPKMGHAFDPPGYAQISEAVTWVLGQGGRARRSPPRPAVVPRSVPAS